MTLSFVIIVISVSAHNTTKKPRRLSGRRGLASNFNYYA